MKFFQLRVGVHIYAQPPFCPTPNISSLILEVIRYDCITAVLSIHEKEVRVCPPNGQDEAQGCILPPQVPSHLQPIGVTNWDNVCCSFIEESLNRTNCVVEEDIYLILGEILEEKDVVLEVTFL